MSKGSPILLLTRPIHQSGPFLTACESQLGRRIPAVVSPIIEILPVNDLTDLSKAGTIVVTSSNAVRCLEGALERRQVAAVGKGTAEFAKSFGAEIVATADTAFSLLAKSDLLSAPVLVCRGVHARLDLAAKLAEAGVDARASVIYDQAAKALTSEAHSLLTGLNPIIAPVFSPRSASLLSAEHVEAPITVLAISASTAEAWNGPGEISVARTPDAEAMIDLVTEAL